MRYYYREGIQNDTLDEVEAQFVHPALREKMLAAAHRPEVDDSANSAGPAADSADPAGTEKTSARDKNSGNTVDSGLTGLSDQ